LSLGCEPDEDQVDEAQLHWGALMFSVSVKRRA